MRRAISYLLAFILALTPLQILTSSQSSYANSNATTKTLFKWDATQNKYVPFQVEVDSRYPRVAVTGEDSQWVWNRLSELNTSSSANSKLTETDGQKVLRLLGSDGPIRPDGENPPAESARKRAFFYEDAGSGKFKISDINLTIRAVDGDSVATPLSGENGLGGHAGGGSAYEITLDRFRIRIVSAAQSSTGITYLLKSIELMHELLHALRGVRGMNITPEAKIRTIMAGKEAPPTDKSTIFMEEDIPLEEYAVCGCWSNGRHFIQQDGLKKLTDKVTPGNDEYNLKERFDAYDVNTKAAEDAAGKSALLTSEQIASRERDRGVISTITEVGYTQQMGREPRSFYTIPADYPTVPIASASQESLAIAYRDADQITGASKRSSDTGGVTLRRQQASKKLKTCSFACAAEPKEIPWETAREISRISGIPVSAASAAEDLLRRAFGDLSDLQRPNGMRDDLDATDAQNDRLNKLRDAVRDWQDKAKRAESDKTLDSLLDETAKEANKVQLPPGIVVEGTDSRGAKVTETATDPVPEHTLVAAKALLKNKIDFVMSLPNSRRYYYLKAGVAATAPGAASLEKAKSSFNAIMNDKEFVAKLPKGDPDHPYTRAQADEAGGLIYDRIALRSNFMKDMGTANRANLLYSLTDWVMSMVEVQNNPKATQFDKDVVAASIIPVIGQFLGIIHGVKTKNSLEIGINSAVLIVLIASYAFPALATPLGVGTLLVLGVVAVASFLQFFVQSAIMAFAGAVDFTNKATNVTALCLDAEEDSQASRSKMCQYALTSMRNLRGYVYAAENKDRIGPTGGDEASLATLTALGFFGRTPVLRAVP